MWVTIGSGDARGTSVRVEGERFLIGTGPECQLMIGDPKVAPLHAYFEVSEDGRVTVHDLGSGSGTYVDGERVDGARRITGGERIDLGDTVLTPTVGDPAEEARDRVDGAQAHGEPVPAVRVRTGEGQTVEVAPADGDGEDAGGTAVRVETEGEAVEVVPVGEHRRLRERITRLTVAAAAAAVLAIAALVVILASSGGGKPSTADLARFAKPRTVVVEAQVGPRSGESGTGFVLDRTRGLIVTNFHVVNGAQQIAVGVNDSPRDASLYSAAPCDDVAVLKVSDSSGLKDFPLGSQREVAQGDRVVAVGYPANASPGATLAATEGVVSVVRTSFLDPSGEAPQYIDAVQTTAPLNPGNSGGPLIDTDKHVVGVNAAVLERAAGAPIEGQGYAIGVDRLKQILPGLRQAKSQGYPGFGIAPQSPRAKLPGVVVLPEQGGGAASTALAGSIVTAVNGAPIRPNVAGWCDAVQGVRSGETAVLTVLTRAGKARQVPVRFR